MRDRLLVRAVLDVDLLKRSRGELDGGVQRQRRELLPLGLLHALCLLFGELAQPAHDVLGIAAEGKTKAAAFHFATVAGR